MVRAFWLQKLAHLLARKKPVWVAGVRRAGKTTLAKALAPERYFDCELPRVRTQLEDPELFFRKLGGGLMVLDEVHRLQNPSEVIKIAADYFPELQVIATGSSTLAAKRKFHDTLTGRK
jgi:uncharacterized protein